jgi:hypothetical protein
MLVERLDWPISSVIKHFCVVFVKPPAERAVMAPAPPS